MSIKNATAAVLIGAAAMLTVPNAQAQGTTPPAQPQWQPQWTSPEAQAHAAAAAYERALNTCWDKNRKEQSYCMITMHEDYMAKAPRVVKASAALTPAQAQATRDYAAATTLCDNTPKKEKAFCMKQAHDTYASAMNG